MTSSHAMPPALWIGGGSGGGKTTIARTLALRFDLALYRIDARAYARRDRLVAAGQLEEIDEDMDARWLRPTTRELADGFIEGARKEFPLILEDLRHFDPDVTMVIEGPQLLPSLVADHLPDRSYGLWLLPTEQFQRRVLAERAGSAANFTSDAERAREKLVARNVLLVARTRREARDRGLTVVNVDGELDLPAMIERVSAHFAATIAELPAIRSGRRRSDVRRAENDVMMQNVRAFLADLERSGATAPEEGPLPFVCECANLGCERLVEQPPTAYETARAEGSRIVSEPCATPAGAR